MSDLERQLRNYAEHLDESAPSVEELSLDQTERAPTPRRRASAWGMVAGAAAIVVIAVGSVALLGSLREQTASSQATTTMVATTSPSDESSVTIAPPAFKESSYVTLVSEEPTYAGGADGDAGGHPMVDAGPVVMADGSYHTLFAAGGDDEVWDAVFYASSPDGSDWVVQQDPVSFPGVEGASELVIQSLVRLGDGTWLAFFHVAFDVGGHGDHIFEYAIRSARSEYPQGPWVIDDAILLEPGDGTWDSYSVTYPNVFTTDSGWVMFYSGKGVGAKDGEVDGSNLKGASALGMATSSDGVVWVRASDPVFTGSAESVWEGGAVSDTTVSRSDDGWIALYAGRTGGSRGAATSVDGIAWTRVSSEPVLTALDLPRPAIFTTSLFEDAGVLRMYVSNGGRRTTSAVYEMVLDAS